jgi:hypothetical protein
LNRWYAADRDAINAADPIRRSRASRTGAVPSHEGSWPSALTTRGRIAAPDGEPSRFGKPRQLIPDLGELMVVEDHLVMHGPRDSARPRRAWDRSLSGVDSSPG